MSAKDISTAAYDALAEVCGCLSTPSNDAITRALDALDEIEELHEAIGTDDADADYLVCSECDRMWPCETLRLATGLTAVELTARAADKARREMAQP